MNRYLSSSILTLVVACGSGTTTGNDGGSDAASDATQQQDANPSDGAPSDSPSDTSTGGDGGGLQSGANCDPNNNLCTTGLLCCSEPTHQSDPMTAYFCEKPVNKGCPQFP